MLTILPCAPGELNSLPMYNALHYAVWAIQTGYMKIKEILRDLRRRYREPLIRLLIKLFAYLPFPVVLKVGAGFGWVLWAYNGEMRRISEKNLALCFPQFSEDEIKVLAKQSLIETGKNITEIATLWCKPKNKITSLVQKVEGEEHIKNAIDNGRGVILLAPHLGSWEVIGLYISPKYPMTSMYRPPEMQGLEDIVRTGRTRFGSKLVPTDVSGVRGLLASLRKSEVIGILPDQDPGSIGGEFAPFFNVQANTMTLTSKLAQKTNADVIGCFARRKKNGAGYELYFAPANKKINEKNMSDSLEALNSEVEKLILKCPEQYQWGYKRFKSRPDGEDKFYN